MIFVFERVENIVGKGENVGDQHFLLFQQCFQKESVSGSLKSGLFGKELSTVEAIILDSKNWKEFFRMIFSEVFLFFFQRICLRIIAKTNCFTLYASHPQWSKGDKLSQNCYTN